MNNQISCSIVTFHNPTKEIIKLLNCLIPSCVTKIFIVDNSLNDDLQETQKLSNKIEYIHNKKNLGYGAGHNIALQKSLKSGFKYHIIINPDISFEPKTIEILENYMNNNQLVGLVMPKILYPNGDVQYLCKLLPTPIDLIIRRFIPIKSFQRRMNNKYELRFTNYNSEMEVPSLSGCFMFIRCEILGQSGIFDERYFMYAEDFDLCRRIGMLSKTIFYPNAQVYHSYEKGSYKNKKLLKYHICSIVKYFNKWGWFFDSYRRKKNRRTLHLLKYKSKK